MGILNSLRSIAIKGTASTINITRSIVVEAKSFADDVEKESQIRRIEVIEHTDDGEQPVERASMRDFVNHVKSFNTDRA